MNSKIICRNCKSTKLVEVLNLGKQAPANFNLHKTKILMPLEILVCKKCFLVQTKDCISEKKLFGKDYPYYSSYSNYWLDHAQKLSMSCIKNFKLNKSSFVIEIASNDGYLLKNFVKKKIPVLGIEPSTGPADISKKLNINVLKNFFSSKLAKKIADNKKADLVIAINVLAHVPDVLDFIEGISSVLKKNGRAIIEFQYLVDLIKKKQFDTMYHEHFSYFSVFSLVNILKNTDLMVYKIEKLKSHGGSLRIFLKKKSKNSKNYFVVKKYLDKEIRLGINRIQFYKKFKDEVEEIIKKLKNFLKETKKRKLIVVGYGAAAKSTVIINRAKLDNNDIKFVVDKNPNKQNTCIPGTNIPVVDERHLSRIKPNLIIIFPWNIKDEIITQLSYLKNEKTKFLVCIPKIKILKN
tara:strand:+ start:307 stop:1530 length:1224 start_codon:yes stop_codon:yes gene_type:complete